MLFPNPANDHLIISNLQSFVKLDVVITDLSGRTVLRQKVNSNRININTLGSGTYIVELFQDRKRIAVQKFIK
jgi:hypothetical protein